MSEASKQEIELVCMGYDKAASRGREAEYMLMMNRGGSGGYTPKHIADAKARDAARVKP